ncbi:CRISPR-associated protein Csm7 [Chromatium okenii]|jgi:CRISPR-associated protein Csm4|uniref:type III-A CRISPR-associated RAMP protein Csm4 n=1 Tax=Chromatium okenii TaxID=61644 RepID=UPI0026EDE278|nr:CRISPR-associated protein Csm7 [Chromatium okenii]MBV5310883.1 CRISPR-associated protein Csm7 [Chromatium okenii]
MDTLALRLRPLTAFGSPLLGDTLFGQVCWAVRHRFGLERLNVLLEGYTAGHPFVVVADAFPEGYLPRPALPLSAYRAVAGADRKQTKRRHWIPLAALAAPLPDWLQQSQSDADLIGLAGDATKPRHASPALTVLHPQPHNSISRLTGTTGRGDFAPYTLMQRWHTPEVALCCRVVFDSERIAVSEIRQLFEDIGLSGFGRDASIGLGKFSVEPLEQIWPTQPQANACLTLAPCAPQGLGFDSARSYYEVFTRFGRHGDLAVQLGNPFKTPLLLARAGAILTPSEMPRAPFIGQGLGGDGRLSKVIPDTVHQGYAPCIPIHLPLERTA